MKTENKIYKKLQNASSNGEKDFPAMDKLWNRVEEKLDTQVVVQKKNTWQKLAVAASVSLVAAIIYIFTLKEENRNQNNIAPNSDTSEIMVSKDSVEKIIENVKENVVDNNLKKSSNFNTTKDNIYIKSEVVKGTIALENIVYDTLSNGKIMARSLTPTIDSDETYLRSNFTNNSSNIASTNSNVIYKGKVFDAISVNTNRNFNTEFKEADKKLDTATPPLLVVDGKTIKNNFSNDDIESVAENVKTEENVETVVVLKEPLYIINGVEYSEESLFGKNPTSPYAPLDKQKIKSVEVLQAPEAISRYGEKGKKGIVIITTKNGKPAKK